MGQLNNKKVAILVENGFEQSELTDPKKALDDAGAQTHIVSPAGPMSCITPPCHTNADVSPVDV